MSEETVYPANFQFAVPVIACDAQGTAICHIKGNCSVCAFAYAKLNPKETLHFWFDEVKK